MGIFNPTGSASGSSSLSGAGALTVDHIALPGIAGTEFTHTFPAGTKYFEIKTRGIKRIDLAEVTSATETFRIKGGRSYRSPELSLTGTLTIYMTSPDTGDIVEILTWT